MFKIDKYKILPSSASSIGFLAHNKEIEHTESLQIDRVAKVILILWIRRQLINHPDTYVSLSDCLESLPSASLDADASGITQERAQLLNFNISCYPIELADEGNERYWAATFKYYYKY